LLKAETGYLPDLRRKIRNPKEVRKHDPSLQFRHSSFEIRISFGFRPSDFGFLVTDLFNTVARSRKITLSDEIVAYIRDGLGARPLTGSDVEAVLVRAQERAVLAGRDADVQRGDLEDAVNSFIDALDPDLLALQELAAVLACSDKRFLPEHYATADRSTMLETFGRLKQRLGRIDM
jgi:hypothetical protein